MREESSSSKLPSADLTTLSAELYTTIANVIGEMGEERESSFRRHRHGHQLERWQHTLRDVLARITQLESQKGSHVS